LLTSIAAVDSSSSAVCKNFEVGSDAGAVVGDVDSVVVFGSGAEVRTPDVLWLAGVVDGWAGDDVGRRGCFVVGLGSEGRRCGCDA
jgi:hypothetical protein